MAVPNGLPKLRFIDSRPRVIHAPRPIHFTSRALHVTVTPSHFLVTALIHVPYVHICTVVIGKCGTEWYLGSFIVLNWRGVFFAPRPS